MNIKFKLITITLGSIICFTTQFVQADAFGIGREKFKSSQQSDQRRNSYEKVDKGDSDDDKWRRKVDGGKKDSHKSETKGERDNNHSNKRDQQKLRSTEWKGEKRFNRYKEDKPVRRYNRDDNRQNRQQSPERDRYRYVKPSYGLPLKPRDRIRPATIVKRPRLNITRHEHNHREYSYVQGPWYYTRYLSPYPRHFHPIGYRVRTLPGSYIRIYIGGLPYFYFSGIFYESIGSSYVVVSAPIGAFVSSLPEGFIAFSIGLATYYYINDTYYVWDEPRSGYVVVRKPAGADDAISRATTGRLIIYPNRGQSEDQQARDRYECHRWSVSESGFDPTLEENEYSANDNNIYRRAIAACLEGRDYTVK